MHINGGVTAPVCAGTWLMVALAAGIPDGTAHGQASVGATPTFEVASVKLNTSGDTRIRFEMPPGTLTAINVPVRFAVRQAYRLPEARVLGGPSWVDTERFDIVAKAPSGAGRTSDDIRQMLRTLLAERFSLAVHTEDRNMPIYSLTRGGGDAGLGPNLRPSATDCAGQRSSVVDGRVACGILVSQAPTSASLRGGGTTMAEFVRLFGDFLDRPLIDDTGLTGTFDLELRFAALRSSLPGASVPGGLGVAADVDDIPNVFTAVQEQLGLRLESRRGVAQVLVIDNVSAPSEN
jgi:uncharacterized protein (TIGR03435 family)